MTIAANQPGAPDVRPGRLDDATLNGNFADLHPLLTPHEARVEAERCYFCFDPPCQQACPTAIDIPLFIRQIAAGNRSGAATTILDSNIMGGMCARVCPTETLCEEACVREAAETKPVVIAVADQRQDDQATHDRDREIALRARRGHWQACRHCRRRARRSGLRARTRHRGRRQHDLRAAREGGRPQRIWHRRLQGRRRLRRPRSRFHSFDRGHRDPARPGAWP